MYLEDWYIVLLNIGIYVGIPLVLLVLFGAAVGIVVSLGLIALQM